MHTEMIQVCAHETAGSKDNVEALVEPLYIATHRAFTEARGSLADDLRQIGVIKRGDRNSALAGGVSPATPPVMNLCAGLNRTGLEREQQIGPTLRIQGQTVVERAGHGKAAQRAHITAV